MRRVGGYFLSSVNKGREVAAEQQKPAVYKSMNQTQQPLKQLQTKPTMNPTNAYYIKKLTNSPATGKALAQRLLSL